MAIAISWLLIGTFFLLNAWLGRHWNRTKSQDHLRMMMSAEGRSDEMLTAAKTARAIVLYPRRLLVIGWFFVAMGLIALATVAVSDISAT